MIQILSTKLTVPQINTKILLRHRLFNLLNNALNRKAILITGVGGCGKSTLLSSFIDFHKIFHVWYSLEPTDRDPLLFLTHIVKGIKTNFNNMGDRTEKVISELGGETQWQYIVSSLLNEIDECIDERFFIVLDDFHSICKSRLIMEILSYMIKYSPPKLSFIISSRERPERLTKLALYGEISELNSDNLFFNKDEIRELFSVIYRITLSDNDLNILYEYTEGWILCLRLISQAISGKTEKDSSAFISRLKGLKCSEESVFQYFNEEVFLNLQDDTRLFLKHTSVLNQFNHSVCNFITGKDNAAQMLDIIIKKELFIIKIDNIESEDNWYRYHNSFRDFLKQQFKIEHQHDITELNKKAACFFKNKGNIHEAFYHFIQARDFETAAQLIEDTIVYTSPFNNTILRDYCQLEMIPEDALKLHPIFLAIKGWSLFNNGKSSEAISYLRKAREKAVSKNKLSLSAKITYFMLLIYGEQEDYQKQIALTEKMKSIIPLDSYDMFPNLMPYASALIYSSRPHKAEHIWNRLMSHESIQNDMDKFVFYNAMRGILLYLPLGMLKEALRCMEEGLIYFKENVFSGAYHTFSTYQAIIKEEMGLFKESSEILNKTINSLSRQSITRQIPSLWIRVAINEIFLGNTDHARYALNNGEYLFLKTRDHIGKKHFIHIVKALLAYSEDDRHTFLYEAEEAITISRSKNEHYDFYQVACWLSTRYADMGEVEFALKILDESIKRSHALGNAYGEARSHLLFASIAYDNSKPELMKESMSKALEISAKKGYYFLFLNKEKRISQKILISAFIGNTHHYFVSQCLIKSGNRCIELIISFLSHKDRNIRLSAINILSKMEAREAKKELTELVGDKSADVREAAQNAIAKIQSLPPLLIRATLLGTFRIFIGNREIPRSAWKRKSVFTLLKYLLVNGNKTVSKDKLIDLLYPENNTDTGWKSIRQAISDLRKVLEPGIPNKGVSSYLKSHDGLYTFCIPEGSFIDIFEFERLYKEASGFKNGNCLHHAVPRYSEMVKLYQEDFLEEDIYDDWTFFIRERYNRMYLSALIEIARHRYSRKEYESSMEILQKYLNKDQFHEEVYFLLMRCYLGLGNRVGAIKVYRKGYELLKNEFGIEPSQELVGLYKRIVEMNHKDTILVKQ